MKLISSVEQMLDHLRENGDFSFTKVTGISFPAIPLPDLTKGLFIGCDFSAARRRDADLSQASFLSCRFHGLTLTRSNLFDACFTRCDLERSRFVGCDLSAARFSDCALAGTVFLDCDTEAMELAGPLPPPASRSTSGWQRTSNGRR